MANKRHQAIAREYARVGNMAELARRHGVSRERIRQILNVAGADLHNARSRAQLQRNKQR
jgi:hypothetical protein